jgi:4-hydroxy-3-polyprenylbenzoate decarboxylase
MASVSGWPPGDCTKDTYKWPGETQREWGRTISMDADVQQRMDGILEALGL